MSEVAISAIVIYCVVCMGIFALFAVTVLRMSKKDKERAIRRTRSNNHD